jgi:hypothetical protein
VVVDGSKIGLLAEEAVLLAVSRHAGVALGYGAGDAEVWDTALVTSGSGHGGETELRLGLLMLLYLLGQGPIVFC